MGGEPFVDAAEVILQNHPFIEEARALFGSSRIRRTWDLSLT